MNKLLYSRWKYWCKKYHFKPIYENQWDNVWNDRGFEITITDDLESNRRLLVFPFQSTLEHHFYEMPKTEAEFVSVLI